MLSRNRVRFSRLRLIAAFMGAMSLGAAVFANAESDPATVYIALTGDDGLTQKLQASLEIYVSKRPNLRLSQRGAAATFIIGSATNVDWDSLNGKTVIIYRVFLIKSDKKIAERTGVCFERKVSKCAKDIVTRFESEMKFALR